MELDDGRNEGNHARFPEAVFLCAQCSRDANNNCSQGRKLAFTFTSDDSKILVYNSAPSVAGIVYDAEIHVWDTETGGEIASFAALHFDRPVPAGDLISSGNSLMCAASTEQGMGVWDISAGTRLLQFSCRNFCSTCWFNADNSCVIGYFNSDNKSWVCL
jgi:WD40 repeat protein